MIYTVAVPEELVMDWLIDYDEALMSFKSVELFRVTAQHKEVVFELKAEEVDEYYDEDEEKPNNGDGENNGEGEERDGPKEQGEENPDPLYPWSGFSQLLPLGEVSIQGD